MDHGWTNVAKMKFLDHTKLEHSSSCFSAYKGKPMYIQFITDCTQNPWKIPEIQVDKLTFVTIFLILNCPKLVEQAYTLYNGPTN